MKSNWFRYFVLLLMVAGLAWLPACDDDDPAPSNPPANNNPPADNNDDDADTEPALEKADLMGDWAAPGEPDGDETVTYSFDLSVNDEATYTVGRMGPQTGSAMSAPGSWDLAGDSLILISPVAEMNGNGDVVGGQQVTINGRTYNKQ